MIGDLQCVADSMARFDEIPKAQGKLDPCEGLNPLVLILSRAHSYSTLTDIGHASCRLVFPDTTP